MPFWLEELRCPCPVSTGPSKSNVRYEKTIFVLASDDILVALTREIGTEFLDCQLKMCDHIPNYFVKMHCAPAGP